VDKRLKNTEKAVLVIIKDKEYWLPKSQVTVGVEKRGGKWVPVIDVLNWLVKNHNL
jgi:hypothetical protein